jgi:hypothetical protein
VVHLELRISWRLFKEKKMEIALRGLPQAPER